MKKSLGAKTIIYPTPVLLVGTYDSQGKPNAMVAAWGGVCCSSPPCVAVSLRKATYSYDSIMQKKVFTVSIPSQQYVKEADHFGIASGREEDKFTVTGLTPVKSDLIDAPYIKEFPVILECKVIHTLEIGLHTQFVGEVLDVKAEEELLDEKGIPMIEKVKPIMYTPDSRQYYGVGANLGQAFSLGKEIK